MRGIAEQESVRIYYLRSETRIPEIYRKPPAGEEWEKQEETKTVRSLRARGSFRHKLEHEPLDRTRIEVEASYPKYQSGKRVSGVQSIHSPSYTYMLQADTPIVTIDYKRLVAHLKTHGVREADSVTIEIRYPRPRSSVGEDV